MAEIKYTKSELRRQRARLVQLEKYLPTLQLKKAQLQLMVNETRQEIVRLEGEYHERRLQVSRAGALASDHFGFDLASAAKVETIRTREENVAGVDIPLFEAVEFAPFDYALFGTPAWLDSLIEGLRTLAIEKARVTVAEEKKRALEHELREVTIRVNLFEKSLIPQAVQNIRRIRVFLGDQELAAISQAKVAKKKIEKKKEQDALSNSCAST